MSELPIGWSVVPLSELATLKTGPFGSSLHKSDYTDGGIPVVNPMHIVNGKIVPKGNMTVTAKTAKRLAEFQLRTGDVIIGRRGEMGRCAVVEPSQEGWLCGTGSLIIRAIPAVIPKYLQRFLSSPETVARLEDASVGSTMVNLNQRVLLGLTLPLAPLAEQKLIVDKLDLLLTRVDACRERLDHVPLIIKLFRQSVLAAAMSGKLTGDWPKRKEGWRTHSLGSVLRDIRYGTARKSHYDMKAGTPVIRIPNIGDGRLDSSNLKFGVFSQKELDTLSLQAGDLLLIRSNGSLDLVGKVAVVEPEFEGYLYAGYLIRLRLNTSVIVPQFLSFFLSSPDVRRYIELTARSTTGVNNINTEEIRAIQLKLPSVEQQNEIVRRIEALFSYAARLEARHSNVRARVEQLTPALLSKAFSGDLVPQDPKDEPAAVLLERIRALDNDAKKVRGGGDSVGKSVRNRKAKKPKAVIIMLKRKDVEPSHLSDILKAGGPLSAESLWSASQLDIDDFYDQLKQEEASGLLKEIVGEQRLLEAA